MTFTQQRCRALIYLYRTRSCLDHHSRRRIWNHGSLNTTFLTRSSMEINVLHCFDPGRICGASPTLGAVEPMSPPSPMYSGCQYCRPLALYGTVRYVGPNVCDILKSMIFIPLIQSLPADYFQASIFVFWNVRDAVAHAGKSAFPNTLDFYAWKNCLRFEDGFVYTERMKDHGFYVLCWLLVLMVLLMIVGTDLAQRK